MKGAWVALERAAAVRDAARGWRSAGLVDAETESRIADEFPDPRLRPSWAFRALTFLLVTVVVLALFLALMLAGPGLPAGLGVLCLVVGGACVAATEAQQESPRLARRGGAGATALWAGVFLSGGAAFLAHRPVGLNESGVVTVFLAASAVAWGTACLRWGSPVWAIFSATSSFFLLARVPAGRVLWVVLGAGFALAAARYLDDPSWAPLHRASAAAVQLAGLAALYMGVNTWSLETQWIEKLRPGPVSTPASQTLLAASAVATAVVTAGVLGRGIRARRTLLLDAGIVLSVLSLVTLRHYVPIVPLWAVLVAAGATFLLVALGLNRWLSRAAGKQRGGFTAEPLFVDEAKARLLEVVPVAATLSPSTPAPEAPDRSFRPGGGSFGGGGASERF